MWDVMGEDPTPPSNLADVPDEFDEILLQALAKERENRHDHVIYLRDELQGLFETHES